MAESPSVTRGPNTRESREEVKGALQRALKEENKVAVGLGEVIEASDNSRATVNKRLQELVEREDNDIIATEVAGNTAYTDTEVITGEDGPISDGGGFAIADLILPYSLEDQRRNTRIWTGITVLSGVFTVALWFLLSGLFVVGLAITLVFALMAAGNLLVTETVDDPYDYLS